MARIKPSGAQGRIERKEAPIIATLRHHDSAVHQREGWLNGWPSSIGGICRSWERGGWALQSYLDGLSNYVVGCRWCFADEERIGEKWIERTSALGARWVVQIQTGYTSPIKPFRGGARQ